jgi:hypothetical protein
MPRFYSLGLLAAIAIAWIGALVHRSGNAPVGLVSVGIGIGLGAALSAIAAMLRIAGARRLLAGTIVLALVAVIAQHTWLYLDFRQQWQEARDNSPQMAMFRAESPWSPFEYLTREATPRRVALWCIDAALIAAASITTVCIMRGRDPRHLTPDT